MDDAQFDSAASAALQAIERALEASGVDADFQTKEGGVLEIEFADGSKIIVNRHSAAKEIWVAARSGGFHFAHRDGRWLDTRSGGEFFASLAKITALQAGETLDFG